MCKPKIIEALYFIGSEVSNGKASDLPRSIDKGFVEKLEEKIDSFNLKTDKFIHFTVREAIVVNQARVTVRRLERRMTELMRMDVIRSVLYQYVNRLSDYLFVLAAVIEEGRVRTYDMMKMQGREDVLQQGAASTSQMTDAIIEKLR